MSAHDDLREGAARRNRALRKILASKHLPREIKLAIAAILDLLCPGTDYEAAWPSAAQIAQRSCTCSRRTGQWYVRVINALGIFHCEQLPPQDAIALIQMKYAHTIRLNRCTTFGVHLFFVNLDHPLWDSSRSLPTDVDWKMGEIAHKIKAKRNAETTSRLASSRRRLGAQSALAAKDAARAGHEHCEACGQSLARCEATCCGGMACGS